MSAPVPRAGYANRLMLALVEAIDASGITDEEIGAGLAAGGIFLKTTADARRVIDRIRSGQEVEPGIFMDLWWASGLRVRFEP